MKNRRTCSRIELNVPLDVDTPHNFYEGHATDIGVGGLFVATRYLLEEDREVTLNVRLPGEDPMKLTGIVAWRREHEDSEGPVGYGVQFVDLDGNARGAIDRFVARRTPERPG